MKTILVAIVVLFTTQSCHAQASGVVGAGCDGCELMFIDMPSEIRSVSYSPAWSGGGERLLITGTVVGSDGITPVAGVVIYYWQANREGAYVDRVGLHANVRRHGYIRGWIKSDTQGRYSIYTIKPGAYPGRDSPAHIHLSIKEPNIKEEYYVDSLVFQLDPLLTATKRNALQNRGGSGILITSRSDGIMVAQHDVALGLNIPNYPEAKQ